MSGVKTCVSCSHQRIRFFAALLVCVSEDLVLIYPFYSTGCLLVTSFVDGMCWGNPEVTHHISALKELRLVCR